MATARRLRRARMAALKPYGLTPHQAGAFLMIARHGGGPGHHGGGPGHQGGGPGHQGRGYGLGRARGDGADAGPGGDCREHGRGTGELRLSDLAARLRIAARSVTEVVDALCEKGLVQRRPSPTDRRATAVELTEAGARLHEDLAARRPNAADLFAPLSEREREQLHALLSKLHADDEEC
ncbi:winged helix DNA-binding protein [Pseudactinotalea sp. HY158]|nr:winged helix DNA-binding protein [Pseudactinotalea sp. HY158]